MLETILIDKDEGWMFADLILDALECVREIKRLKLWLPSQ